MRALLLFLLLGAVAVALALFAKVNDDGYVLIVSPPYRLEISLNAFVLLAVAGFAIVYAVLRFGSRLSRLPREVREHRKAQHVERARNKQDAAVIGLLEGRYGRARQCAEEALAIPHSSGLAALIGARAALETRDFAGAAALLGRPDAQAGSLRVPRLMLEAELALEQGRSAEALARLAELKRDTGAHTAALRLELRTLRQAGRHEDVPALLDQLAKRKVYDAEQADLLRSAAHAEALQALSADAAGLRAYWNKLTEGDRAMSKIALAGARSFAALGHDREAAEILAKSLERHWDPALALQYAECRVPDGTRQLERAEHWLQQQSGDAQLLRALGRLCERQQLWGKAQTYYEASLALDDGWHAHVALGEMLARLGRDQEANAHLAAALK